MQTFLEEDLWEEGSQDGDHQEEDHQEEDHPLWHQPPYLSKEPIN
jgi:hypothetical protein